MILTRICLLRAQSLHIARTAVAVILIVLGQSTAPAQPAVAIGQNFTASTYNVDVPYTPPDANGVVGPLYFAEFVNGRFSVFDKTSGAKVKTMTDQTFWSQAGVTLPTGWDVTDPRIIYDPVSQRWFASQVDFDPTGNVNTNHFFLGVSSTSDPTGTWKGFAIASDPGGSDFADFPTLGLDAQGVYLSGDMWDTNSNPVGPSLVSIPKAGLLASPPVISGLTRFGVMTYDARGAILQPAICFDGSGQGNILSVSSEGIDVFGNYVTTNTLAYFQVQNPSGTATIIPSRFLKVPSYTLPFDPTQPDGSTNLDDGDARFSAKVYEVGGVLYAVHNTEVNNLAALRWYRISTATQAVLESGTISHPIMDLFYPSIAVNSAGTVVIAYNGSSINIYVSSFAVVGTTVNGKTTFGTPLLLKAGVANYQNVDSSGLNRWGDYSATSVDPDDSNRFWTIQEFASANNVWSTQVTELLTGYPNLTFSSASNSLALTWSSTLFNLQTTSDLGKTNWVTVTQNLSTNNGVVTARVPATGVGFFRLIGP